MESLEELVVPGPETDCRPPYTLGRKTMPAAPPEEEPGPGQHVNPSAPFSSPVLPARA